MKIGIVSLGCPKNLMDSEVLLGKLTQSHEIVHDINDADVVLINTCSFIEQAREESVQTILEIVHMKDQGIIRFIVVCGCLPQKFSKDLEREIPEIDAMIGTFTLDKIETCIAELGKSKNIISYIEKNYQSAPVYEHVERYKLTETHTRYIKIAEGCNHSCSFCIIPELRGHYRSRPIDAIVAEANTLIQSGAKEIILVAQDTSLYGIDIYKKRMLAELMRRLNDIPGNFWIRVMYLYPNNVDADLIAAFKECEHVCNYIDMPVQHASDTILKRMKRNVSQNEMLLLIDKIRSSIKDVVLRTSVIVGYPGETYREFNELLDFIEKVRFERLGAFIYSDERSAASFRHKGKVKDGIKKDRFQDLMLLQQDISRLHNERIEGRELDVLVDGDCDAQENYFSCRSYMDAPEIDCQILVKQEPNLWPGDMLKVKVTRGFEYDLEGILISKLF